MLGLRKALAIVSLWVPAALILLTWRQWQSRLPPSLPTHWGVGGPADAVTSAPVFLGWLVGVSTVSALVGTIVVLVGASGEWGPRATAAFAGAASALVLGMWLGSTVPSLDAADPFTVEIGGWILLTLAAPAYALVQLAILPRGSTAPIEMPSMTEEAGATIAPDHAGSWNRTISSPLLLVATGVMVALGVALFAPAIVHDGIAAVGIPAIVYLAAVVLVLMFCAFRVTVDRRGLQVTSAIAGIPLKRIPPAMIAAVDVVDLEPRQWGGWGYRIMPGRSAIILRRGPGLVITLTDQRQFAITLDEPDAPARVLLGVAAADASPA